jgi:hypothetical protein
VRPLAQRGERRPRDDAAPVRVRELGRAAPYGTAHVNVHAACLAAHTAVGFPLMYHWRVLPDSPPEGFADEFGGVDGAVAYWDGSPAVRERLEAIGRSSAGLVLFLEHRALGGGGGHSAYDRRLAASRLLRHLLARTAPGASLREWIAGVRPGGVRPEIAAVIDRHARPTLVLDGFHRRLLTESRRTPFPAAMIEAADG